MAATTTATAVVSTEAKIAPFSGPLPTSTKQVILVSEPKGVPVAANFTIRDTPLDALKPGQFLVRILYLSIDPFVRKYFMGEKNVGQIVTSYGVGDIIASNGAPSWPVGTYVIGLSGATEYAITDGTGAMHGWRIVDPSWGPVSTSLGVLGATGATAWFGLRDHAPFPKGGTVVVSGAAGAVGSIFGQLAKAKGAGKVIGIAGGPVKCAALLTRGFDVAIDYKNQNVAAALRAAAPHGIDHYFDNVGGAIANAALLQLKNGGSTCLCGTMADYNGEVVPSFTADEQKQIDAKNIVTGRIHMFAIYEQWATAFVDLAKSVKAGQLKYDETFVDGFESFGSALISQLAGGNTGKMMVRLAAARQ